MNGRANGACGCRAPSRRFSVLFILVSLYFGSGAIFAQLGSFLGYVYWIVGIVLIVLLAMSIRMSIANDPGATSRSPGS